LHRRAIFINTIKLNKFNGSLNLKDDKAKENYLVIDVRDEAAYKEGHLKHAINIPTSEIEKSIEQIRTWRDKKVVV